MQELLDFVRESIECHFTKVHTTCPGVVTEYNASTRRAIVQPSLKRQAGNKEFVEFPLLVNVPVIFPGTKRITIHFPLEKKDEVVLFFSERAIGLWKSTGQDGIEDTSVRRYSLSDAYCMPGLQAQEFPVAEEAGLQILLKDAFDGELISQVLMTDDKVEAIYKKKATVLMEDDHITAKTEKCTAEMQKDCIKAINSKNAFELNDAITLNTSGSGLIEIGNAVATIGGILDELFTALQSIAVDPASHTGAAWATSSIVPLKIKSAQILKK